MNNMNVVEIFNMMDKKVLECKLITYIVDSNF